MLTTIASEEGCSAVSCSINFSPERSAAQPLVKLKLNSAVAPGGVYRIHAECAGILGQACIQIGLRKISVQLVGSPNLKRK